jgi:2-phosphoglycerate kinase
VTDQRRIGEIANRPHPDWKVLLIGGASGTGKTRLSYPLARRFGVPIVEVDDIVEALQAMTTPDQQPALHHWATHPEAAQLPAEGILQIHLAVAESLALALAAVVANHLETDTPVIIEGDYLVPGFAARDSFNGIPANGQVASLFLHEADEVQLVANYSGREPGEGEQQTRARVSVLYGEWLAAEAGRYGVPVIRPRPWSSLERRVLALLGTRDQQQPHAKAVATLGPWRD